MSQAKFPAQGEDAHAELLGTAVHACLEALRRHGLRELVISPGSRSTPLVIGALQSGLFQCYSVIDERAAAFFALGLAKRSKLPVGLICTSGSALAHYLPALLEAKAAEVPLVALTADRPDELQDCGAPQTLDQSDVLRSGIKSRVALAVPRWDADQILGTYHRTAQIVSTACQHPCGPVHVNFAFAKPLEPSLDGTSPLRTWLSEALKEEPSHHRGSSEPQIEGRAEDLSRTVISIGPLQPEEQRALLKTLGPLGVPLLSEHGGVGTLPLGPLAERGVLENEECGIRSIVHFGPPVVSSAWNRSIRAFPGKLVVFPGHQLRDPSHRAARVEYGDLCAVAAQWAKLQTPVGGSSAVFEHAKQASTQVQQTIARLAPNSELRLVNSVLTSLPKASEVHLANSLAIRLASWAPAPEQFSNVYSTRGLNGIDGLIAAAAGAATGRSTPTALLIGDVATSHDLSSLALVARYAPQLCVIVLDNGGGRIFDHLPAVQLAEDSALEWDFWTTPPRVDWNAAAQTFGLSFFSTASADEVPTCLSQALASGHGSLLHLAADSSETASFLAALRSPNGAGS